MADEQNLKELFSTFQQLIHQQENRIQKIKETDEWTDFSKKDCITVGVCYGDGIGKEILTQALTLLNTLLEEPLKQGKLKFKIIEGLTIENRVAQMQAIPEDVLSEIKSCDVILKGPTTTPQKGGPWPNIESANVKMRKELDLFANIRPVKLPEKNIDWHFFRENTEGEYALGSQGLTFSDFCMDFKVTTKVGTERICRAAFEFAKKNNKDRVTIVTKSNIMKATDGLFSSVALDVAKEYEKDGIRCDEYYIDIMTANLINDKIASEFQVMVLPNLYGDILTDQAGQIQGGVGTAGSANIGKKYSMFEAIHGSAPRLIEEGLAAYANPCSIIKASALLLQHIGYQEEAQKIEMALDMATLYEKKFEIHPTEGITGAAFAEYLLSLVTDKTLKERWLSHK